MSESLILWTTVAFHSCMFCDRAKESNEAVGVVRLPRTLVLCHHCMRDLQRELLSPIKEVIRGLYEASIPDPPPRKRTNLDLDLQDDLGWELSVRAWNCLHLAGIRTLRDLLKHSHKDLLKLRNFGKRTLNEILEQLAPRGLRLGLAPHELGWLDLKVADMLLSVKAEKVLQSFQCEYLSDVVQLTEEQVYKAARSKKTVREINDQLAPYFTLRIL